MDEPKSKRCSRCDEVKPLDEFPPNPGKWDGCYSMCRSCKRKASAGKRKASAVRQQKYRQANGEKLRDRARQRRADKPEGERARFRRWHEKARQAVFDHYGWQCACCGSAEQPTIDHVNGDGGRHRKEIGAKGSTRMYRWLIVNRFPAGFQTLCGPCNRSKGNGDRCRLNHAAA